MSAVDGVSRRLVSRVVSSSMSPAWRGGAGMRFGVQGEA
jgi:hypothetical protein